jgi:hypothetical protein
MSEIHFVERVPRRPDFCGCPPCHLCYEPVISDDQQAPTFEEVMKSIYGDGPVPQTEQEYEWAHAAAHETRQELEALRADGTYFEEQDRAHMTEVQIEDMLKQARKSAAAPKPLNRVNLDDMPVEAIEAATKKKVPTKSPVEIFEQAQAQYQALQMQREIQQQQEFYNRALTNIQTVALPGYLSRPGTLEWASYGPPTPGSISPWKGP